MLNLSVLLEESARRAPAHDAVVFGDTRLAYAEIDAAANMVAHALRRRGVEPGDRVALGCPNLPYFPIVYYGILKAGAVVVPLNVLLKTDEIAYHLEDSGAVAYLCFEGSDQLPMGRMGHAAFEKTPGCRLMALITAHPAAASPIDGIPTLGRWIDGMPADFPTAPTQPGDTAVILYTSGTTGRPKGAELSHANMVLNARLGDTQLFHRNPDEVHLITLPLFHSFGQTVQMNMGFYQGATLVLMPRFDPDRALALMERERVTFFAGVPTMYWAILHHPGADEHDLEAIAATLTSAVSGGSALPLDVLRGFEARFGVKILEGYGLSETSPIATFNHASRETHPGTVGQPVWGVQVRVVDEHGEDQPIGEPGEVWIKGHNVMKGYFGRPDATAEALRDGWLRTGDVGTLDIDDYLTITDRIKDMINRGGFNVYPREVEELLMEHPAVSLAAVVGVPDERLGEEIKAYVILVNGAELDAEGLIAWSRERMADYKVPRRIEFRESLPMTATGKILKRELRG